MSKKHEEHEEHVNHEAWVIPYADMLTLLMALFLVMWATQRSDSKMPEIDPKTAAAISEAFSAAELGGSKGVLDGLGPAPVPGAGQTKPPSPVLAAPSPSQLSAAVEALKAQNEIAGAVAAERNTLVQAREDISKYLASAGISDQVAFRLEDRGLVVSIVSDQVLFDAGSDQVRPDAVGLMDAVAGGLRGIPNQLVVEGHTDARPTNGGRFASNWELSTARATSVLQYLVSRAGVDGRRLSATGYADTKPIAANETTEGRAKNRRVEIVVVSTAARAAAGAMAPGGAAPEGVTGTTLQTPAQGTIPETIRPDLTPGP